MRVYAASMMAEIQPLLSSALARANAAGGGRIVVGLAPLAYAAGLATSFTPCTLTMLPLTVGYIASEDGGGDAQTNAMQRCECCGDAPVANVAQKKEGEEGQEEEGGRGFNVTSTSSSSGVSLPMRCASFSLGLTTTYTTAGVAAALLGSGATYGNFGADCLPIAATEHHGRVSESVV